MWDIRALLFDALSVSESFVEQLAGLERALEIDPCETLSARALAINSSLREFNQSLSNALRFDFQACLEPELDHLWDDLVLITSHDQTLWGQEGLSRWQECLEILEELNILITVIKEECERQYPCYPARTTPCPQPFFAII